MERLRAYYTLTKPGIVRGNAVHVVAGALLATRMSVDWSALLGVLIGTSLIIASACVANNYMDRGIDARMKRTRHRPSVTGLISFRAALIYLLVLLVTGIVILYAYTNLLVLMLGVIAYGTYVFAYGWSKRHTVHSTLIGAIPGALPAMAGYVAISGELSIGAWLVFLLVFMWQMPHFYAISLFRKHEYQSAKLPVLGAVRPFAVVRRVMLAYIIGYTLVISALIYFSVVGAPSGLLLLFGAAYWTIVFAATKTNDEVKWARSVFGASLILTILLLIASLLNVYAPPTL